jgi:ribosomal protein L11 methyltransferase
MNDYFVVRLKSVTTAAEEWVSAHAFEFGALGVSEVLGFRQPEGEEDVFVSLKDLRDLEIYFQTAPPVDFLRTIERTFSGIQIEVKGETNKDWLAEWKKGFAPFSLSGGHWVVPSWCETPREATFPIRIDPGMAFGTGTHETTQLVARTLTSLPVKGSLLDVGTGTGILAILANHLGYAPIAATEIEPEARRVARENFQLNQTSVRMDERQVEQIADRFDVVVANIIDGVLVRIQDTLKARVKSGGWLVVSGIIKEREKDFLSGFQLPSGATWEKREAQGDWLLFATRL